MADTYAEVKGSRSVRRSGRIELFYEHGVVLVGDTGQPAVGNKPEADGGGAATAVTDYVCTDVDDKQEIVPGLRMVVSVFKKFVAYS